MGRKKLQADVKRRRMIHTRVNDDESDLIGRAVELLEVREGTWIRETILREAKKVIRKHEKAAE